MESETQDTNAGKNWRAEIERLAEAIAGDTECVAEAIITVRDGIGAARKGLVEVFGRYAGEIDPLQDVARFFDTIEGCLLEPVAALVGASDDDDETDDEQTSGVAS